MAAIPVTLTGTAYVSSGAGPKSVTPVEVTIVGDLHGTGLGVGGGPMPGQPPGIWGGAPPQIGYPLPGQPPHVGGGPIYPGGPVDPGYGQGRPLPPYASTGPVIPPKPTEPPPGGGDKPPPDDGGWGYVADWGWGYFPAQSDKPQPGPTPPSGPKGR
jgi:preprotein translocase subunit SecD